MLEIKDIEKLAELARIDIPAEEKETLRKEVDAILAYVGEIQKIAGDGAERGISEHRNVFREDKEHHLSGEFTKELLESAPRRQDEYVKVKNIL